MLSGNVGIGTSSPGNLLSIYNNSGPAYFDVKGTGDGTLSYFESAYKASKCAKTFQESIYDDKNMNVRVGIHIGDIVFEDELFTCKHHKDMKF